jgi:hypothetical protein
MKLIKFDAKQRITNDPFRHNENIEPQYLLIADMVLSRLYKAFPFNSLFEGFSWENQPNDFYKSVLVSWADCFMEWKLDEMELAEKAVSVLIEKNIIPSLGLFLAAYQGDTDRILIAQYEQYINYVYSKSKYENSIQIAHDVLVFGEWSYRNADNTGLQENPI